MEDQQCPCSSGKSYVDCCGTYISGKKNPDTAEQLMRSRYTAFHNNEIEYLRDTLHPSKQSEKADEQYKDGIENTKWLKLIILNTENGQVEDTEGMVEFAAFYKDSELGEIHESSKFVKENGRWFYLFGRFLPPMKQGRNDTCLCGSGKKFKKCHGK